MSDFLAEIFERLSPEEQARIREAEASASYLLENGDAEVNKRLRFAGSLDDRDWLLEPQDEARAYAAGVLFIAYVNALWLETDWSNAETVVAFLHQVDKLIPPVLEKYGMCEASATVSELRAECGRGAWRVHDRMRRTSDPGGTYARFRGRDSVGAGKQEELLNDARAWAAGELLELLDNQLAPADLQRQVVKKTWDRFLPTHKYRSELELGYREFSTALWTGGVTSLQDLATVARTPIESANAGFTDGAEPAQATRPREDPSILSGSTSEDEAAPESDLTSCANSGINAEEPGTVDKPADQPPLHERVAADDPNRDLLRRFSLESWADSHGLVADGMAGEVSLSSFVERCARSFKQGAKAHVDFKDTIPISKRCDEIDRMADGAVAIFSRSLAQESERLGHEAVAAAIEEYSRRVLEIAARSKQDLHLAALAELPESPRGDGAGVAVEPLSGDSAGPDEAKAFANTYKEIAGKSEAALAAFKQKVTAPRTRVLYQDIEQAIWSEWRIRPEDITVRHIGQALYFLAQKAEGGVELDPISCDVCGIDYSRLVTMIRASMSSAGNESAMTKVPRKPEVLASSVRADANRFVPAGDGNAVLPSQGGAVSASPRSAGEQAVSGPAANPVPQPAALIAKQTRAATVGRLIRELSDLRPQMFEDEAEYNRLRDLYPSYLTFQIADSRADLKRKVLAIRASTQHIRLAQELAGAHHSRQLATIQDDWKDHKPAEFRRGA
jgi:hypothetical protein